VIAVTGASGFIGRALVEALAAAGAPVREVSRQAGRHAAPGVEHARIPGLDRDALGAAFRGSDVVVHLAGRAHRLAEDAEDPLAAFRRVNVDGTRAVLEAAADAGVRRVILASSVKAVGESNEYPWDESTPPEPTDPYGVSKLEAERVALEAGAKGDVEAVVVRLPLVYGPGAPANVLRLLRLVDRGWPLPLGAIENRRSMLSLGNLLSAVRCLAHAPGVGGEVFFVADGVDLSTPELVRTIAAALGRPARLLRVPPGILRAAGRAGDAISGLIRFPLTSAEVDRLTGSLTVSIDKLTTRTGVAPPETPAEGWRRTAAWFRGRSR
jgi:nucleoside-diphosphate-sugar epimerase